MNIIYYEDKFDWNEWFTIINLIVNLIILIKLKKIFPLTIFVNLLLFSFSNGMLFDHSISLHPIDFYDVNDNSSYQLFDFLSYVSFAPYGYYIIYFYERFSVKTFYLVPYILLWSLIALSLEWLANKVGLYHYKEGYKIGFSFVIYLFTISIQILLYRTTMRSYYLKYKKA